MPIKGLRVEKAAGLVLEDVALRFAPVELGAAVHDLHRRCRQRQPIHTGIISGLRMVRLFEIPAVSVDARDINDLAVNQNLLRLLIDVLEVHRLNLAHTAAEAEHHADGQIIGVRAVFQGQQDFCPVALGIDIVGIVLLRLRPDGAGIAVPCHIDRNDVPDYCIIVDPVQNGLDLCQLVPCRLLGNRNVKIVASKFRTAETLVNTVSSKFWNGFLQGIFSIYWVCGPLPNFGRLNSANLLVSQKLVKFQGY